mgnify:CR=1 FL=1
MNLDVEALTRSCSSELYITLCLFTVFIVFYDGYLAGSNSDDGVRHSISSLFAKYDAADHAVLSQHLLEELYVCVFRAIRPLEQADYSLSSTGASSRDQEHRIPVHNLDSNDIQTHSDGPPFDRVPSDTDLRGQLTAATNQLQEFQKHAGGTLQMHVPVVSPSQITINKISSSSVTRRNIALPSRQVLYRVCLVFSCYIA